MQSYTPGARSGILNKKIALSFLRQILIQIHASSCTNLSKESCVQIGAKNSCKNHESVSDAQVSRTIRLSVRQRESFTLREVQTRSSAVAVIADRTAYNVRSVA